MSKTKTRRPAARGTARLGRFVAIVLGVVASATVSGAQRGSPAASETQPAPPSDIATLLGIPHRVQPGDPANPPSVPQGAPLSPGVPVNMAANSALSAAVITNLSGQGVNLLGDWDGQEDLVADHAGRVANLQTPGAILTRAAISEHTMANGFPEDVFYYGDSIGNVYVASTTNLSLANPTPQVVMINLPTVMNAFGALNSDSQIVVTGLAVSPVVDLSSFANVNGAYSGFNGVIGEILYVTFTDTGGGFRLTSNGQPLSRSGLLAFPIGDAVSPAPSLPGTISSLGFPVTVGGSFGVAFSRFSNLAGVAVDDDGSVYIQQVDLLQMTGANLVKIASTGASQYRSAATSGFVILNTLTPPNGLYGTSSGPATQINTATNYSGTSSIWGNVTALAAGAGNVLYAAVARSFVATDDPATQNTEGLFANPVALGATPSMIISLADCSGTFDGCTAQLPIGDGIAEPATAGVALQTGVNNFRVFAMGDGPDRRGPAGSSSPVFGTVSDTLKLSFQVDYTIYSGLAVDEEGSVYVVSGGTPANVGRNPSPTLGEILVFPDSAPADRRADYIDLRGDVVPNPPLAANVGDFDSDRFDHIFWQAPIDLMTMTPAGVSGLARGFLLYLNRTRTADLTPGLPNGSPQANDVTSAAISFGALDPGHQVGGGDDQVSPFTGDDSDGGGTPTIAGPLEGGFEFTFGNAATPTSYNAFFLNSNGSVSFGAGDASPTPTVNAFLTGAPKIAPAWTDLNPGSRSPAGLNNFPVQAVGFAGVNHFKIRWINVPTVGSEACNCRNTFSVSLFDDGTGLDENASQPIGLSASGNNAVAFDHAEGPTALRYLANASNQLVGRPARPAGSGYFTFTYGRMDLIGSAATPVLVGFSGGALPPGDPGQLAVNFSSQTTRIGNGSQTAVYELFNTGTPSAPAFDLRFDGNDPALCTPGGQTDPDRGVLQFTGFVFPGHLPFTDEPLVPNVTPIKAQHINELRSRVAGLRNRVPALGFFFYTDPSVGPSVPVMARIVNELRTALTDVYVAHGLPAPVFAETLVPGSTPVRAAHIQELRDLVGAIE